MKYEYLSRLLKEDDARTISILADADGYFLACVDRHLDDEPELWSEHSHDTIEAALDDLEDQATLREERSV